MILDPGTFLYWPKGGREKGGTDEVVGNVHYHEFLKLLYDQHLILIDSLNLVNIVEVDN